MKKNEKILKIKIAMHWLFKKFFSQAPWAYKKSKQRWIPVKFFKDKVQCSWALEAKSEFNLEIYRKQRSFRNIVLLLKFRILTFESYTLDGSGEAFGWGWRSTIIGKTSFTLILTKFDQNWENLKNPLGFFSCHIGT